jgi:glycosyltransferase involved in cell wall biosynthesis
MCRKIVFINQATGYLTIDIINEFAMEFSHVALITGSIRVQEKEISKKVQIVRIAKYNRGSTFRKGLSWIIATVQINFLLRFRFAGYERFYFTIPPTAYLFARNKKLPYSITVYDLFPDALRIFNVNTEGAAYKWWRRRNARIFNKAHRIYALSYRMKEKIQAYTSNESISVIPNWTAFTGYSPLPKHQNSLLRGEGLTNKFIVQYSGNIGATHNVEVLIDLAIKMTGFSDVHFSIIGRGERVTLIHNMLSARKLSNCSLLPFRKDSELYESLCAADLAVVTLDERIDDASVPSKLYNLMSAGIPVMAIAAMSSEIAEIVSENSIGKVFNKSDLGGMMNFIIELKKDMNYHEKLRQNSLKASKKYTSNNARDYLEFYLQ